MLLNHLLDGGFLPRTPSPSHFPQNNKASEEKCEQIGLMEMNSSSASIHMRIDYNSSDHLKQN